MNQDFELWFNDRTPEELGQIIQDFYIENILDEECEIEECVECRKRANAINFHRDSIIKYDDKEIAAISLLALYELDRDQIDDNIEKGLKRLGILQ